MEKIEWCRKQKKGIRIIDLNLGIVNSYIRKSNESLEMIEVASKSWKVICSYYACYDILYALLQRYNIKCEIHDCSIELLRLFDEFSDEDYIFLKRLKESRIYAQYYVDKDYNLVNIDLVKKFILKVKEIINKTNEEKVELILIKLKN